MTLRTVENNWWNQVHITALKVPTKLSRCSKWKCSVQSSYFICIPSLKFMCGLTDKTYSGKESKFGNYQCWQETFVRWGTRRVPHLYNQCFPFVRPTVRSSVCYRNLLQKILACFCYRKYFLALLQKLLPSSVTENTYFDLLQKPIQSPQKNPVTDRWTNPLKSTKTRDNH